MVAANVLMHKQFKINITANSDDTNFTIFFSNDINMLFCRRCVYITLFYKVMRL
jgi:hypothetical protein